MEKKNWIIPIVILALIVLVIIFKDKFIVKEEEIIEADYCQVDSDCVLAVNPNGCCHCPIPMNREVVDIDEDYEIYDADKDYKSLDETCARVFCVPCAPVNELICQNNKCSYNTST